MEDVPEITITSRKDREITKRILHPGDYDVIPYESAKCHIMISAVVFSSENGPCEVDNDSKYFKKEFDGHLVIGDADCFIDLDFEICLQRMFRSEMSALSMVYKNKDGRVVKRVSCKVEIIDVEEVTLVCDWSSTDRFESAKRYKERGIELVKDKRLADAFRLFGKALKFLISIDGDEVPDNLIGDIIDLRVKLYNNVAHCQLHYHEYEAALVLCNKALMYDDTNVKALYRRGSAYMGLERWEEAQEDISKVLEIDPTDKSALQKASVLKDKVKTINDAYKAVIKKMFG